MNASVPTNSYKHHRFPAEIISHGVWLYYRFCLSYRDVEELLFARGVIVTGAAHAGVQVAGSRAALPLRVWTDRPTFPPTTPPASCPRVPPRHGPTISDLVRSDRDYRRITVRSPWGYVPSCPRSASTCNKLTTPPGGKRKADTVSLLRAEEPVLQISALSSRLVSRRSDGI
jgi:hypothetical protein